MANKRTGWSKEKANEAGRPDTLILDRDLTAPPVSPADADVYIVATGGTGAWAGQDDKIAGWNDVDSQWEFIVPPDGFVAWVADENKTILCDAGSWSDSDAFINHDVLLNFVANEHIDWVADQGATNIHAGNVVDGADATAIHDNVSAEINAVTEKTTPVSADLLLIEDSAASNAKKRVQIGNLPGGSGTPTFEFQADQLLSPNNSDWTVNALAPLSADSNNNALGVRLFDDTTEEGVGFLVEIPTAVTTMKIKLRSRAETAPAGARTVGLKLYNRGLPDDAAVQSWTAGNVLADIDIPTNENFQYDEESPTLATLSVTAGEQTQFELTRINPTAGTELTGDWALLAVLLEFS